MYYDVLLNGKAKGTFLTETEANKFVAEYVVEKHIDRALTGINIFNEKHDVVKPLRRYELDYLLDVFPAAFLGLKTKEGAFVVSDAYYESLMDNTPQFEIRKVD